MFKRLIGFSMRCVLLAVICVGVGRAQGTADDYQRAAKFIQANAVRLAKMGDVAPHWIVGTNRFWYRLMAFGNKQFILVEPAQATKGPAFDHEKLAAALTRATRRSYEANNMPFETFDFSTEVKFI